MNWELFLENYGYLAVFIGSFFEGETVMLLGAYAVHQHFLHLYPLIIAGALGGFAGDQLYFYLGYKEGHDWLVKRPLLMKKFEKVSRFIQKYPIITIFIMRFAWGFRTILPVSFGIRRYCIKKYVFFNALACLLWSSVIVVLGVRISVYIHRWLHELFGHFHFYKTYFLVVMVAIAIFILVYHLIRKR